MILFAASVLAICAVALATVAATIIGTIVLVHIVGINYEWAGYGSFWTGLILSAGILVLAAFTGSAAVICAALWILGISLFFLLAWLLPVLLMPR